MVDCYPFLARHNLIILIKERSGPWFPRLHPRRLMLCEWTPYPTTTHGTALLTDTATSNAGAIGAGKLTVSLTLLTWNESAVRVACWAIMEPH